MCGIAGIVHTGRIDNRYSAIVKRMVQAIAHRGPDCQSEYATNDYSFGHARLSIVDLVDGGQPMLEEFSKNAIVFNGEIYGYKDIKREYGDYSFKTKSDTELLLAMYSRLGEQMPSQVPGMFAFSIWDTKTQKLFAARDRFGEKPFYYAMGKNGEFIFSSEMKAILSTGLVDPILDEDSVAFFLKRFYVKPDRTIFKNIFTLPPAHALVLENGKVRTWKYWEIKNANRNISLPEAKEEFLRLINKAVEKQLVADVPVAAFLSGGLDSSTIVALASKLKPDLNTFSFGFEGDVSELKYAQQIATKYSTQHITFEEGAFDVAELLTKMHTIYDEPFADSSNIPTYLISKLARKHAKVVLTGDGCDELMGGYNFWYRRLYQYEKAKNEPGAMVYYYMLMRSISYRMKSQTHLYYNYNVEGFEDLKRFKSLNEIYALQRNYFSQNDLDSLFIRRVADNDVNHDFKNLTDIFNDDLTNYMPGDILVKTDRAAMANGLELRAPFLDKDFAEFCISLPNQFKITPVQEKVLLREACRQLWTDDIRRRKKQGFAATVSKWLELPAVAALKEKYLGNKGNKIFSVLNYEVVKKYATVNNNKTWALLNLSMWMENYQFSILTK